MPIVVTRDDARRRFVAVATEQLDVRDIRGLGSSLANLHRSYSMILDLRAAMLAFTPAEIEDITIAGLHHQSEQGPRGLIAIVADNEHLEQLAHAYAGQAASRNLPAVGVFRTTEAAHSWLDEAGTGPVLMKLALATCATVPDWEVDDRILHAALAARGVAASQCVWDDPAVNWADFDAVLIRTAWDYQEKREAFVAWAERVSVPLHNPAAIVRWNTHKAYLRDLEQRGIPIIPTEWLARGSTPDVAALCRRRGWSRAFLKPCVGATARETLRFETGDPAAQAHASRLLATEDLMLQPYLPRVETDGELSAIFIDGELTHAVRKVPVAGDYRVQDDFGAKDYPIEFPDVPLARRALEAVGQRLLYGRADFLPADDGLLLTELELVEPSLFFRHGPHAAGHLADAIVAAVSGPRARL